ncbi:MAG: peptidyl-prolyl cis-trans isomerase [Dysgonamonadaceae bacterium]|nr:peptidyl-prolyl cis-trans isomerase [Dysgonamonadaceae bacterium]
MQRKLNNSIGFVVTGYILFFSLTACIHPSEENDDVVVRVGNRMLTRSELSESLPSFHTPEDSILSTEHFIRVWVNDQLLYNVAQKNIADKNAIEQLVENYRRSLIIYQYQEQLVNEKVVNTISEQELRHYYEENKDKFKLDKPLIKGIFLRVPIDAPTIDKAKSWCKNPSSVSIGNLEKYSMQNAGSFDYFETQWVDFNELMHNWPVQELNLQEAIKRTTFFEQKDDKYYYFLHISDYLLPGDNSPFQYAEPVVKELLINRKKIEFLRKTENDLYNKALNSGQILFYNE